MEFNNDLPQKSELDVLKERADLLGITYHPSIGVEKLREKVSAKLAEGEPADGAETPASEAVPGVAPAETPAEFQQRMINEATKLVRIRVACMNPVKKEWEGEIFTTGNAVVGTHKKYVPFNTEDGWHVPYIIYEMIKDRECQIFVTKTLPNGNKTRTGKLIKEFAVEILPQLTEEELKELAQRQAMAGSVG